MQIHRSCYTVLIPHETPRCAVEQEHARILSAARAAVPDGRIVPFYPQICVLRTELPITELKTMLTGCVIEPPVFADGLFIRPVTISAKNGEPVSAGLPEYGIPFSAETCAPRPGGILFGCVQNGAHVRTYRDIAAAANLSPISLRVFRLHTMRFEISAPQAGRTPLVRWTLSAPLWVKISD
ncbi:hypothetical protein [Treponema brennaborense]|uniref:Uncharacterized protein n=1 Tax=Treponema brennaborense (strain DSM 12168 / CIP 105900 / DD5/3) TaxID=906968 RepID=F4LJ92_TREBD|nr:hypothetical protein [Treponema brennaborense]AEE16349.1 hypothetical protein Trebr_0913 [Treponema brennaborense DSM 12168]